MNTIFHEGEYHIQEIRGVRSDSDSLSSMIKKNLPIIAIDFLKNLNFSVISFSTNQKNIFSSLVYDINSFIEIKNDNEIVISLNKRTYIPKNFFKENLINIGFIGLDFKRAMRIRINGKGKIKDNKLFITIDEVYSNCPKHIYRRILQGEIKASKRSEITEYKEINKEFKNIISNANTFFLASSHKEKGLDISHKGGKRGFVTVLSSTKVEFEDVIGNNLFNSLGNIYTNPYISMIFINFEENRTYHIKGIAKIIESMENNKVNLKISIECENIIINTNSFQLKYNDNQN